MKMRDTTELIITCEHGGNKIPSFHRKAFRSPSAEKALVGHRGHDYGALAVAKYLAKHLKSELFYSETSRLLVDLNRSPHHRMLHSEFLKKAAVTDKRNILERHYRPYRDSVEAAIQEKIAQGNKVLHLSIHSFTPAMHGEKRNADIGLLYDPGRKIEKTVSREALKLFQEDASHLPVKVRARLNYPYRGDADGFMTHLRQQFSEQQYCGIEIELNHLMLFGIDSTRPLYVRKNNLTPLTGILKGVTLPLAQSLFLAHDDARI